MFLSGWESSISVVGCVPLDGCAFLTSRSDVSAGQAFLTSRLDISAEEDLHGG